MTTQQKTVYQYLKANGRKSVEDIYLNTGLNYYRNWRKHTHEFMYRMVKAKMVRRVARGLFEAVSNYRPGQTVTECPDPAQIDLFGEVF